MPNHPLGTQRELIMALIMAQFTKSITADSPEARTAVNALCIVNSVD